jgi:hypothetical protein
MVQELAPFSWGGSGAAACSLAQVSHRQPLTTTAALQQQQIMDFAHLLALVATWHVLKALQIPCASEPVTKLLLKGDLTAEYFCCGDACRAIANDNLSDKPAAYISQHCTLEPQPSGSSSLGSAP